MEIVIMVAQLLLGLSILVGLHELGHLLTAKMFGMRVEQYYIGFPPKIFGFRYGETEYNLGAVPLGGFVKITGMIDESLDTKNLGEEPEPWEFRAKPAWQRLIVMMGGIIVNVVTGIIIFILLTYQFGDTYIPREEVLKNGIVAYDLGEEIGLKTGDKILKVNGEEYVKFTDLVSAKVLLADDAYYTVERGGQTIDVPIPVGFLDKFSDKEAAGNFFQIRMPFEVGEVVDDSNAQKAGLQAGDKILSVDGEPIAFFHELRDALAEKKSETVALEVLRTDDNTPENQLGEPVTLQVDVNEEGNIGFYQKAEITLGRTEYTLAESIPQGTVDAFNVIWVNALAIGKIFKGEVSASKSLSGPIAIAKFFGGTWDWEHFWRITGLLSMVLAFM
ncbi:MAG: RIP metalloprotease RseP, partial [Bacteroidota bacterium]